MSREAVVAALTAPELKDVVDLVVWVEDGAALAANHLGRVRLHADGRHDVLDGIDPVASEDPMAFLPYAHEVAQAGPSVSTDNAYPYAAQRILSLFADADRSPDVAVVHTPRHFFPEEGGHVGEHGSLDVIQSRAPFLLAGAGVRRLGLIDEHARLVDVGPTLAYAAGVPRADLTDARGEALDGQALTAYLEELPEGQPRRVVGLLWDGAHSSDLLELAGRGELPGVARLLERGLALRGGAVAEFPSVTLTNHTSILTGVGPGRHGVLGNVFYDRATGERVVPNDASTWHRSAEWLRPAVRTVFEMVNDAVPAGGAPRTASVDEPVDRGADYSTMGLIRASESSRGAAGLDELLPDPRASAHLRTPAHL
jgi:phosphonoacetate hydrolase